MSEPEPQAADGAEEGVPPLADLLRDGATRAAALDALDAAASVPVDAGPALGDLLALDAAEVAQQQFDRVALLVARMVAEAADDRARVWGSVFGAGRFAAVWRSEGNALAQIGRKPAAELSRADAVTLSCWGAHYCPMGVRGWTEPHAAASFTPKDFFSLLLSEDFVFSKCAPHRLYHPAGQTVCTPPQPLEKRPARNCRTKMPDDETARRLLTLLLELLGDGCDVPRSVVGGASCTIRDLMLHSRSGIGAVALEADVYGLLLAQLRTIGGPSDYMSISRGETGFGGALLQAAAVVYKSAPDITPIVSSGLFEESAAAVTAVAAGGADGLADTDHCALACALAVLRNCTQLPECEDRLRSLASPLAFLLEPQNDLDWFAQLGTTSSNRAAGLICAVFGRDEGGSEFAFTQQQVDSAILRWSDILRAVDGTVGATAKPTPELVQAVELCVSDQNKPLLLANEGFVPYLVDALLLVRSFTVPTCLLCPIQVAHSDRRPGPQLISCTSPSGSELCTVLYYNVL